MTSLRNQLGNIEWGGSNYTILLKDMELSHLTNCQLLCARKVKEFTELDIKPCEYRGLYHREWLILFKAQRVLVEGNYSECYPEQGIWDSSFLEELRFVLAGIAARNMSKLKEAAQKAADEAYARTMEAKAQHRHTTWQGFDPEWYRNYSH